MGGSVFATHAAQPAACAEDVDAFFHRTVSFCAGLTVRLVSLKSAEGLKMNGMIGTILRRFSKESERWSVLVDGEVHHLHPQAHEGGQIVAINGQKFLAI